MAGHGPDGARPVAGTEPVWTGPADLFQLRLHGRARGLRVRFVRARRRDSPPVASAARRARAGAAPRRPSSRAPPGAATASRRAPPPLRRRCSSPSCTTPSPRTTTGREDSAGIVLSIARYHRDSNGWNDIGYNFLVDKYGQIFEARAGGIDSAVIGAQAQGYNCVSTGIACLGTFEPWRSPSPASRRSRT